MQNKNSNIEELIKKGKMFYSQTNHGEAMNCFKEVLRQEPDNTEAQEFVSLLNSILEYFNKDTYNP
ncbi:MAG: hypothetical protein IMY73_04310 [Bacteroidetes bacterium]|nr:hypothetical protein [Bacteroidota bacterium]